MHCMSTAGRLGRASMQHEYCKCSDAGIAVSLQEARDIRDMPLVHFQQLQNAQHNVVDVAEARGFGLFGMMHTACVEPLQSSQVHRHDVQESWASEQASRASREKNRVLPRNALLQTGTAGAMYSGGQPAETMLSAGRALHPQPESICGPGKALVAPLHA